MINNVAGCSEGVETYFMTMQAAALAIGPIIEQDGLVVASIARDDSSTLPGDDPFLAAPACTATAMRGKLGSEFETYISYI